jgi:hypothetical protein
MVAIVVAGEPIQNFGEKKNCRRGVMVQEQRLDGRRGSKQNAVVRRAIIVVDSTIIYAWSAQSADAYPQTNVSTDVHSYDWCSATCLHLLQMAPYSCLLSD